MNIVPLNYKGEPIRFNTDGWINATDIAKRFGKRLVTGCPTLKLSNTLELWMRFIQVNHRKFYIPVIPGM